MERECVDAERVGDHVQGLAEVADAVCATQPQGVVEVAVDVLRVVTPPVEPLEVAVAGWDRSHVLRPVELPFPVFVVAVEANGDGRRARPAGDQREAYRLHSSTLGRFGGLRPQVGGDHTVVATSVPVRSVVSPVETMNQSSPLPPTNPSISASTTVPKAPDIAATRVV